MASVTAVRVVNFTSYNAFKEIISENVARITGTNPLADYQKAGSSPTVSGIMTFTAAGMIAGLVSSPLACMLSPKLEKRNPTMLTLVQALLNSPRTWFKPLFWCQIELWLPQMLREILPCAINLALVPFRQSTRSSNDTDCEACTLDLASTPCGTLLEPVYTFPFTRLQSRWLRKNWARTTTPLELL